jgi:CubicO group peptidase (beta-lactamase class C family)
MAYRSAWVAGAFWLLGGSLIRARADSIDDYLKAQMAKEHIPALSITIVRDGKVLKLKSYGVANLEWSAPSTPHTAFQLASATKLLTTTALMRLVEQGRIALDDPVTKYLPGAPAVWNSLTIRRLTAHMSGLGDLLGLPKRPGSLDEAMQTAFELPLQSSPGEKTVYASSDYVVLMRLIERVTGKPFPVFLHDELCGPLGMTDTRFDGAIEEGLIRKSAIVPHRASIYNWEEGVQKNYELV